jgi:two-component system, NarL family, sensor kinase
VKTTRIHQPGRARHSGRAAAPPAKDGAPGLMRPARASAGRASSDLALLRARLAVADETLRAIRTGEVDSVVIPGKTGSRIFTLNGAEHAYRVLIECMNEGALTLTGDQVILYANQCFARMVKCPLEKVNGSSFRRFLSVEDRATLQAHMKRAAKSGSKIHVQLRGDDDSRTHVLLSIRELANPGSRNVVIGIVVTDMTEAKRTEEMLRALSHRVVQVLETERGRVALELHGHITQLLCAVLVRSQTLADHLAPGDPVARKEAIQLRRMLGEAAQEVERISRHLRPSILDELGLVALMRSIGTEFTERTGVPLRLTSLELTTRLPCDIELTLYRILQEALQNVRQHAHASHVTVRLTRGGGGVQMAVNDDGIGFDPNANYPDKQNGKGGLGLLSMRERAAYVNGTLKVTSAHRCGSEIIVDIPVGQARAKRALKKASGTKI